MTLSFSDETKKVTKTQGVIDELKELIKRKVIQRETLLDNLSLLDVKVDKYDELIINMDKKILPLLDEINEKADDVQAAYQDMISHGCRSDLKWVAIKTYRGRNGTSGGTSYQCMKNPDRIGVGTYYGLKFYKKPHNRDYGSNLIAGFLGNVGVGSDVIAAISTDTDFSKIQIGDEVTDGIDNPTIFPAGSLPTVIGFGLADTNAAGVGTVLQGNTTIGSNVLVNTGIGTTSAIPIGSGIGFTGFFPEGTVVESYGSVSVGVTHLNPDLGDPDFVTETAVVPTYVLSNVALANTDNHTFHVNSQVTVPSLILSGGGTNSFMMNSVQFHVIRTASSVDEDFDYLKNPIDPVTIGLVDNSNLGVGHKALVVSNNEPVGPFSWHEVRQETEPSQGADGAWYNQGTTKWPVTATGSPAQVVYAREGQLLMVGSATTIGDHVCSVRNVPPSGSIPGDCSAKFDAINDALVAYQAKKDEVLEKVNRYVAHSRAVRMLRDDKQIQQWGYLQGAAHSRGDIAKYQNALNEVLGNDLTQYE